jgi:hypothetical protein
MPIYAEFGVSYAWLVDPLNRVSIKVGKTPKPNTK